MGLSCKAGYFTLNTSTGNQAITGLGFQPKFIIFLGTVMTADGTSLDLNQCIGFATSSTSRRVWSYDNEDNQGTADSQRTWRQDSCIFNYEVGTSTQLYRIDLVSMDSGGFTLDVEVAPSSAYRIGYIAFGGSDISNVTLGQFDTTAGTGNQAITGLGFQPDFLFMMSNARTTSADNRSGAIHGGVGFASGSTEQVALGYSSENGVGTMNENTLQRNNKLLCVLDDNENIDTILSLVSFDSGGFTFNKDQTSNLTRVHYLAVKGGNFHVDSFNAQSSTGTFDITDPGFEPCGLFLMSGLHSTATTVQTDLSFSFGVASGATSENFATGAFAEDGVATSNCFDFQRDEQVYTYYNSVGTESGAIEFDSFLSDGFRLDTLIAESGSQNEVLYFAIGSLDQEVSPNSITSGESFGTPQVDQEVSIGSISSAESFGTPTVIIEQFVSPVSIVSAEAFGSPTIIIEQFISPVSISSAESFGVPEVNIIIGISSIPSAESFGIPIIVINQYILPNSINSAESFGVLQVDQQISVGSVSSAELFGTPSVIRAQEVLVESVLSAESFGVPVISKGVQVPGISSDESFGIPSVHYTLYINSVPSAESFGIPTVNQSINVDSVESAESFGIPSVSAVINVQSIPSAESFGISEINLTLYIDSIISAESFGDLSVNYILFMQGIPSAESFGLLTVSQSLGVGSISSAESFGIPDISFILHIDSILSAESFGNVQLDQTLYIDSIVSAESFGTAIIGLDIVCQSIPSAESVGIPEVQHKLNIESILSAESFGIPTINQSINVISIPSSESFGVPKVKYITFLYPISINSGESFGETTVIIEQFITIADGIPSQESVGICSIVVEYRNSFKHLMEEDLNLTFFNAEEFAIPVTICNDEGFSKQINAIFDNEFVSVDADSGLEVMSRAPVLWLQDSKLNRQIGPGFKACVQGINYQIVESQPDGTGLLVLVLKHDRKL